MSELKVRCEGDRDLHSRLLATDEVQSAQRRIEDNPAVSMRRRLLATSLRLTESMSPKLSGMLADASKRLDVDIPIETYVYNSPTFNAACVKPEGGTLLLMFSSSLLERFDETELRFVMGHELGHYLCGHHDIPIGALVGGKKKVGPRLALQLFSWSRYAEISADRMGAVCADDADGAARALFKLASGLTTDLIEIRIDEFAAQADEMDFDRESGKSDQRSEDWFMTHPFTPLRVRALQMFFQSNLMTDDGIERDQLESGTHELMEVMSPTYLEEQTPIAETMRRVLFAAGCGLMQVSGEITVAEVAAFDQLFGVGTFSKDLDLAGLEEALKKRIDEANESVSAARRIHIVRDLCLIAVADGHVSEEERAYVRSIANRMQIGGAIVEHFFDRETELD